MAWGAQGNRRWWLWGGAALWAALLAGLGLLSVRHDPPTVPEQRDVAAAVPAVRRATGAVLAAVGGDRVVAFDELQIIRGCPVTPVRAGAEVAQKVTVYLPPGEAPTTLAAVAAALPPAYHPAVSGARGGARAVLRADAGDFVAVHGDVDPSGAVLTLRSSSGCRPESGDGAPLPGVSASAGAHAPAAWSAARPQPMVAALAALKSAGVGPTEVAEVRCPGGGAARTLTAYAAPAPADLAVLAPVAGPTAVQAQPRRYAYRAAGTSMVAEIDGGRVRLRAGSAC